MNADIYQAWRRKADEDLLAASNLLDDAGPYPTVCFLSQQAAEKYLKGYLLFHGRPLQKVHFVDRLLEDCVELNPGFHDLLDDAAYLTQYYIATRYPTMRPRTFPRRRLGKPTPPLAASATAFVRMWKAPVARD